MARAINIESDCDGDFIVDEVSIRSTAPIALRKSYWQGNTLKLEGANCSNHTIFRASSTLTFGLVGGICGALVGRFFHKPLGTIIGGTLGALLGGFSSRQISHTIIRNNGSTIQTVGNINSNGDIIISNRSQGNVKSSGDVVISNVATGGTIISNGSIITVNGVTHTPETEPELEKKLFEEKWQEKVQLASLNVSGTGSYHSSLPLSSHSFINNSGTTNVHLRGTNPNTTLNVNLSGTGSIVGCGELQQLKLNVSGVGSISGFTISDKLNIKASGVGTVNLNTRKGCSVSQKVSGVSKINLTRS